MKLNRVLCLLLVVVLTSSGCAAILGGGSNQPVSIEATPSSARYVIRSSAGIQMSSGNLPTSVILPRKNEYQIDISLDGYETQTVALSRGTNGWIWGNLVIGWIVGFAVDFLTGAAYKLEPAVVSVTLDEAQQQTVGIIRIFDAEGRLLREERRAMVPLQ